MKLSRILLITLLFIALVPLGVASLLLLHTSAESLRTTLFEAHHEKATSLSREVERHLAQGCHIVPFFHLTRTYMVSDKVRGLDDEGVSALTRQIDYAALWLQ